MLSAQTKRASKKCLMRSSKYTRLGTIALAPFQYVVTHQSGWGNKDEIALRDERREQGIE